MSCTIKNNTVKQSDPDFYHFPCLNFRPHPKVWPIPYFFLFFSITFRNTVTKEKRKQSLSVSVCPLWYLTRLLFSFLVRSMSVVTSGTEHHVHFCSLYAGRVMPWWNLSASYSVEKRWILPLWSALSLQGLCWNPWKFPMATNSTNMDRFCRQILGEREPAIVVFDLLLLCFTNSFSWNFKKRTRTTRVGCVWPVRWTRSRVKVLSAW